MNLHILFLGLLLEDSNGEKRSDHQKKKFFIRNSVEALIQFKEKDLGPMKLHVTRNTFGEGEEKIFFEAEKITCEEAFQNLLKCSISFVGA